MHEIDNRSEIPWSFGYMISKRLPLYHIQEQYEFASKFISAISNIRLLQMCTLEEVYFQLKWKKKNKNKRKAQIDLSMAFV